MTLSEEDVKRMAKRKENVKRIMHDLIWPAAAGNVAWSFIDTTLKYFNDPSPGTPFQILSLLMLAFRPGGVFALILFNSTWLSAKPRRIKEPATIYTDTLHSITLCNGN